MKKEQIKVLLENDLEYYHADNANRDEYQIGEDELSKERKLFEEEILTRVKESGISNYKKLRRKDK